MFKIFHLLLGIMNTVLFRISLFFHQICVYDLINWYSSKLLKSSNRVATVQFVLCEGRDEDWDLAPNHATFAPHFLPITIN